MPSYKKKRHVRDWFSSALQNWRIQEKVKRKVFKEERRQYGFK